MKATILTIFYAILSFFFVSLTQGALTSKSDCMNLGFNPTSLSCSTCEKVLRIVADNNTYDDCKFCCVHQNEEKFHKAVLEIDNRYISYMPEMEAIIKIKADLNLEVKYRFGSPQLKMYGLNEEEAVEILSVSSWSQDNFKEYIKSHLIVTV
jgi:hypothetical protein